MPKVLVTGATGFLGQHLLRELVADGANVSGLSRGATGDAAVAALGATPVRGELGDAAALAAAMAGVSAVFGRSMGTTVPSMFRTSGRSARPEPTRFGALRNSSMRRYSAG